MKEEKSRSDASREEELTALIKENERLKYANEELKREFNSKTEEYDSKSRVCLVLVSVRSAHFFEFLFALHLFII